MSNNSVVINASLSCETRIALIEKGQIQEIVIERRSGEGIVGNIYQGVVTRVLPGMQAAFVNIGLEEDAFLYVDDVYVSHEAEDLKQEKSSGEEVSYEMNPSILEDYPKYLAQLDTIQTDRAAFSAEEEEKLLKNSDASFAQEENQSLQERSPVPLSPSISERDIQSKNHLKSFRSKVKIEKLLQKDQKILVQVAKDPISTKRARLTCHISLPGRNLVCMPTIRHIGVSRRIENEEERRRLKEYVEKHRGDQDVGFIVRTAIGSGKQCSETWIQREMSYLIQLWKSIKDKAAASQDPSLIYEDLNSILKAIRDWVTEDIDKIIVDSRPHYDDIHQFMSESMPHLKDKVELYHGDIPIFDAYGVSTEISHSLERRVWLKSGGYIVIDQAEALVAIDVNTGKYVGKRNLEDTLLKTNLEAVQEIAHQIRLRNCGGIIIVDFIDMDHERNCYLVSRALEEALSKDRAIDQISFGGKVFFALITRKRAHDTITRALCESCTYCEGEGFVKSKRTVAYEILREIEREGVKRKGEKEIVVRAHPDVIYILGIDEQETLEALERRYQKQISLEAVQNFHMTWFKVGARDQIEDKKASSIGNKRKKGYIGKRKGKFSPNKGKKKLNQNLSIPKSLETSSEEPSILPPASQSPQETPILPAKVSPSKGKESDSDEEDQLAFLKAQAAQDAALAQLANEEHPRTRLVKVKEHGNHEKFRRVHKDQKKPYHRPYSRNHQFRPHFRKKRPVEGDLNQSNADKKENSTSNESKDSVSN